MILKHLIFLVFLIVSSVNASQKVADIRSILPAFKAYVEKYRPIFQPSGAAIVIVKDGEIVFEEGFGALSLDDSTPVDAHTVFQIASVTKNFTATLITRLASKGVLSLEDKVSKYVPEFKLMNAEASEQMTVRDLLSHCLGLEDFAGDSLWHGKLPQKEIIKNFKNLTPKGQFRQDYGYSNIAFGIAGIVIEKATGKPYAQVIQEEIFTPLGMTESSSGYTSIAKPVSVWEKIQGFFSGKEPLKKARPHDLKDGKAYPLNFYEEFYLFPGSSGVHTTAHDMGTWLLFHLNHGKFKETQLIPLALIDEMRKKHANGSSRLLGAHFPKERSTYVYTGLGCFLSDYAGHSKITQMGGIRGARALLTCIPDENLGIAVLSNLGGMRVSFFPEAMIHRFLDLYFGLDPIDWGEKISQKRLSMMKKRQENLDDMRLKSPRPSGKPEQYIAKYHNKIYGDAEIITEDNKLFILYRGSKIPLEHQNDERFLCRGNDISDGFSSDDIALVEFGRNETGNAFAFAINLLDEGEDSVFRRVTPEARK